jgi:hypothetical protein
MRAALAYIVLAFLIVGCGAIKYYPPGPPSDEEQSNFQTNISKVQPGMPEEEFLKLFYIFKEKKTKKIGIVDRQQYQSTDYISRTYWIGYFIAEYSTVTPRHLVSVTCTNGVVENIYWP